MDQAQIQRCEIPSRANHHFPPLRSRTTAVRKMGHWPPHLHPCRTSSPGRCPAIPPFFHPQIFLPDLSLSLSLSLSPPAAASQSNPMPFSLSACIHTSHVIYRVARSSTDRLLTISGLLDHSRYTSSPISPLLSSLEYLCRVYIDFERVRKTGRKPSTFVWTKVWGRVEIAARTRSLLGLFQG